jgi:hypothetical protein
MMADSKTGIKNEQKPPNVFSCLFCHINVRKEDLLDHQMVHMKDMGEGGKLNGYPMNQGGNHASMPVSSNAQTHKQLKQRGSNNSRKKEILHPASLDNHQHQQHMQLALGHQQQHAPSIIEPDVKVEQMTDDMIDPNQMVYHQQHEKGVGKLEF